MFIHSFRYHIEKKKYYMNKNKNQKSLHWNWSRDKDNMINCDQNIACIMPKHIKMNKNIMGTLNWKVTKLIGVDQTQIIILYLLVKLYAKSKLFGLTRY